MSQPQPTGRCAIDPHLFRGYSIRGIADRDLSGEVVTGIGDAIGTYFRQRDATRIVVGRDVRLSSPRISRSLIEGLVTSGLVVTDVGLVPTPVHNFATDLYAASAGVMVTASHNPAEYNGLKVRGDQTLNAAELQQIYQIACASVSRTRPGAANFRRGVEQADPLPTYLEHVKAHADLRRPLRVVVDGGNGTNGLIAAQMLRDLGCQVVELYCEPDGRFPNRDPDPTAPGATDALAATVRKERAEVGLAFDGDGDRLVVVDEKGNRILGDQILMVLARDVLRRGPARVAFEILCTRALAEDVLAHGGEPIVTPTGYAFVHAAMQSASAAVGGELSGHLFFNLPRFRFDDAMLGAVRLLSVISRGGNPVSEMVDALPSYHSSPPMRLVCPDATKAEVITRVRDFFGRTWPVDTLDGARIDFGDGWALVRASNTQPALSLRVEATSQLRLAELTRMVMARVETTIEEISVA